MLTSDWASAVCDGKISALAFKVKIVIRIMSVFIGLPFLNCFGSKIFFDVFCDYYLSRILSAKVLIANLSRYPKWVLFDVGGCLNYKRMMTREKNQNLRLYLKRKMKSGGFTYKDIAKKMRVSESAVKKWMTYRDLKVETLIEIGKSIGIEFFDILKFDHSDLPDFQMYSIDQDEYFATHPMDFLVFLKVRHGSSLDEICDELDLGKNKIYQIMKRLEENQIGQLWPSSKFKMKLKGPFALRPNGQMQVVLWPKLRGHLYKHFKKKFPALTSRFDPEAKSMSRNFEFYLTEESQQKFVQELMRTIGKYAQIAEAELESKKKIKPISAIIAVDQYDGWKGCILENENEN